MQLARSLQKMKLRCHNNAAFSRPFWLFRGKNKEVGSPAKILIGVKPTLENVYFEINVEVRALMFS